jgi:hypothetical protein
MTLRVLFISQWFPPEPYLLPLDIARSLQSAGCEVTVLTGIPNYPSGSVMPGYHAWRGMTESVDGLRVVRAPLFPSHDMSGIKRAINYLTFGAGSAMRALLPGITADVSLVFSSPITAAVPAVAARRLRGIPYVMMVQDLWPDVVYQSGLLGARDTSLGRKILDSACVGIYRGAETCLAITPGMRADLIGMGVPADRVEVFWNWGPAEGREPRTEAPSLRQGLGLTEGTLIVVYAGNMGSTHGLEAWVDAIAQRERRTGSPPVHLVFLGDGVVRPALEERVAALGTQRVHFLGRVDDDTFLAYRNQADATIVSLLPSPVFDTSMPSKIPDTLAHGGIIIGSVRGDAAAVIEEAGGIITRDETAESIAIAIEDLANLDHQQRQERRERGRALYTQRMSRQVGTNALLRVLERACARDTGNPQSR